MNRFISAVLIVSIGAAVAFGIAGFNYLTRKEEARLQSEADARRHAEILLQAEELQKDNLTRCLGEAEKHYYDYTKLNATEVNEEEGSYRAPQHVWDQASKDRTESRELCFRLHRN